MKSFFLSLGVLAGSLLFLSSCIDIDARMNLDQGGGGRLEFTYRLHPAVMELEKIDPGRIFLPFPIEEADFRRNVRAIPDLELESYSHEGAGESLQVRAVLRFSHLGALNQLIGEGQEVFTLNQEGERMVFSQSLSLGPGGFDEDSDPQALEFLAAYFRANQMKFTLGAPEPILFSDPSSTQVSGQEAQISYSLSDLIMNQAPLVWRLFW